MAELSWLGGPDPAVSANATWAVIVAAGQGLRFAGERPKQYATLAGRPVVGHSIAAFQRHPSIAAVVVVIDASWTDKLAEAVAGLGPVAWTAGGATRQVSVQAGLAAIAGYRPARVAIHDGARPGIDQATITAVLSALDHHDGALAAQPVTDTLKRATPSAGASPDEPARVAETVARTGLWRAQTPQAFGFDAIQAAHTRRGEADATDDAQLAEEAGLDVALIPAPRANFKITTAGDLADMEALMRTACVTGTGYDVHRLTPGRGLTLCGVAVACDYALVGHSDADVGLHAVCDALLGAAGQRDIGYQFPPDDPRWRDADSAELTAMTQRLAAAAGVAPIHADVTLIAEVPRLASYVPAMQQRLAELLGLGEGCVAVKATTMEGLGFTGRGEGIAAQAAVTVARTARERD